MKEEEKDEDMEFSGKPSSFKEICMNHLARIGLLSSCELRGGYYAAVKTKSGDEKEMYVQDSRESLSNAIYFLAQVLILKFDKPMKESFEKFIKEKEELKQKFLKKTKIDDVEVLGESYYEDKEKILLEEYKIKKMELYKELFTELSTLLARLRYFEIGGAVFE